MEEVENEDTKKEWTDEERKALETKLDRELDDFIAGLRKREAEVVPPDQLAEELSNHPFFLKKLPEDGSVPALVDGLQQLKYSENDNTAEELALALKDDGNQAFKVANYRLAVMSYTEGLAKKCADKHINATLYNNRAAAHFRLKNYRSCYNDCKLALEMDSQYTKALVRLADACMELELFDECIAHCKMLEGTTGKAKEFREMAQKALKKKNEKSRDERKTIFRRKKMESAVTSVENAILERGITMRNSDLANVENPLIGGPVSGVHLEDGKLVWPVVLLYPEYSMTEVIQNFHEDSTFQEQLGEVFAERPEWDVERKYNLNSIRIYYEDDSKPHEVKLKSTLKSVICRKTYVVEAATPAFIIFAKDSDAERRFLNED
uniref:Tetratricopeptide repeat protein 4 n=8 Tax=Lygus hesperus TaxID=30085 RepID=A0A0A9YWE0_LYGHE